MQFRSDHSIAGAILIVGFAISYAIYAGQTIAPSRAQVNDTTNNEATEQTATLLEKAAPITITDHRRGTSNPDLTLIVYNDFECPFCKVEHEGLREVFPEYKDRVQWVARHFPLPIHAKARNEALASECADFLGGNDAFWAYSDKIYEATPSNDGLDSTFLPIIAKDIGLDTDAFNACMTTAEEKFGSRVDMHSDEAIATGGRGTPWNILVLKDGTRHSIEGALTATQFRTIFNDLLVNE